jgi:hypothetical protein
MPTTDSTTASDIVLANERKREEGRGDTCMYVSMYVTPRIEAPNEHLCDQRMVTIFTQAGDTM